MSEDAERMHEPLPERLAIAGGGAIACGLAATAARHGRVVVWARSRGSAARARGALERTCGKVDGAPPDRVEVTTDLEALAAATFVLEAIAEDHAAKAHLLARLHAQLDGDALLATTTSSLPIEDLAHASGRPERFLAFHPFNPVPRMPLVELAFPRAAAASTRDRAGALARALGKTAVEVPGQPGFVVNRLLFPYLFAAVRLLDDTGMSAENVDACMRLGAGHPMGPLELLDFVGLDVAVAIGESIGAEIPDRLRRLVAEEELGRKSGSGLHDWSEPPAS